MTIKLTITEQGLHYTDPTGTTHLIAQPTPGGRPYLEPLKLELEGMMTGRSVTRYAGPRVGNVQHRPHPTYVLSLNDGIKRCGGAALADEHLAMVWRGEALPVTKSRRTKVGA